MTPHRSHLSLALAAAALALAPAAAQLGVEVCTDGSCSAGCTSWSADSGKCAPGTSPAWISSIVTMSGDGKSAVWDLCQDSAATHDCSGSKIATYSSLSTDGNCHAISACSGMGCGSLPFQSISVANVGFVAGIAIAIALVVLGCCVTCCWWQGVLCFKACPRTRPSPMTAPSNEQAAGSAAPVAAQYGGAPKSVV